MIEQASLCRCDDLRKKIHELEHGEYASAKAEVDKLRRELGLEESKSLKSQLEERAFVLAFLPSNTFPP